MSDASSSSVPERKDPTAQHPIPDAWRPRLREIVGCLARGDYALAQGVRGVAPTTPAVAQQIRDAVADYGATLVALPDDTWRTSVTHWMESHWDVLVDLWTAEEGSSDLVLAGHMSETSDGRLFTIDGVYVP